MNSNNDKLKKEIWRKLARQHNIFLATAEGDQPRLRPVTLIPFKNRLYFATGTGNAKDKQIQQNPKTEFCLMYGKKGNRGTIRAQCMTKIVKDQNIKTDLYKNVPMLGEFWKKPSDPKYTLIELDPVNFEYYRPGDLEATRVEI